MMQNKRYLVCLSSLDACDELMVLCCQSRELGGKMLNGTVQVSQRKLITNKYNIKQHNCKYYNYTLKQQTKPISISRTKGLSRRLDLLHLHLLALPNPIIYFPGLGVKVLNLSVFPEPTGFSI